MCCLAGDGRRWLLCADLGFVMSGTAEINGIEKGMGVVLDGGSKVRGGWRGGEGPSEVMTISNEGVANPIRAQPHTTKYYLVLARVEMVMASMVTRVFFLAIVCLALGTTTIPKAQAAVTCDQVVDNLTPCLSYVMYGGTTVPAQCCNGIRSLYGLAQTTQDRQTVCRCIKNGVSSSGFTYSNYNLNLAASLPKKCRVNIPYQISPNTDCSRYFHYSLQ
ncbi:unnamed protein product [Sphenostylis stenocarpa]|uniref:Non-specific lipid-transfer protein n=1 Tax=Sphenostylis stenocarpa TaxID=92480 RepID=A0AA86SK88_9FABA|nr:unnamed protein product [Sphenostylis stenocarpa]